MLNEEVAKYRRLTGDIADNVPISRIGGYLDGFDKGMEILQEIKQEISGLYQKGYVDYGLSFSLEVINKHIKHYTGEQA